MRARHCRKPKRRRSEACNNHMSRRAIHSSARNALSKDSAIEIVPQGDSMKRAAMVVMMLGLTIFVFAQQPASSPQNPPVSQTGAPPKTGAAQQSPGQPGAPRPATTPTTPQGKRPPQAKTDAEFAAFNAAIANTNDPATVEKAADDFAAKFPDSELRTLLYEAAMQRYQRANNADKMMEMGRKVLKIDPDDPTALVGVAQVLAERTRDTDLDKEQRLDEAMKDRKSTRLNSS